MNGGVMPAADVTNISRDSLSESQALIADFKDTLQLLTDINSSHDSNSGHRVTTAASEEEKQNSRFDVDGLLRKNRRKLGLLGNANILNGKPPVNGALQSG